MRYNDKVTRRDGLRACPFQMRWMHERKDKLRTALLPDLPGNESYWAFLNQLSKMNTTLENEDVKKDVLAFIEWLRTCGEDAFYVFDSPEEAIENYISYLED